MQVLLKQQTSGQVSEGALENLLKAAEVCAADIHLLIEQLDEVKQRIVFDCGFIHKGVAYFSSAAHLHGALGADPRNEDPLLINYLYTSDRNAFALRENLERSRTRSKLRENSDYYKTWIWKKRHEVRQIHENDFQSAFENGRLCINISLDEVCFSLKPQVAVVSEDGSGASFRFGEIFVPANVLRTITEIEDCPDYHIFGVFLAVHSVGRARLFYRRRFVADNVPRSTYRQGIFKRQKQLVMKQGGLEMPCSLQLVELVDLSQQSRTRNI